MHIAVTHWLQGCLDMKKILSDKEIDKEDFELFVLRCQSEKKNFIRKWYIKKQLGRYSVRGEEYREALNRLVKRGLLYEVREDLENKIRTHYKLTKKGKRALYTGEVSPEWRPPLMPESWHIVIEAVTLLIALVALFR